jgi:hypothetical protein
MWRQDGRHRNVDPVEVYVVNNKLAKPYFFLNFKKFRITKQSSTIFTIFARLFYLFIIFFLFLQFLFNFKIIYLLFIISFLIIIKFSSNATPTPTRTRRCPPPTTRRSGPLPGSPVADPTGSPR